MTMPVPAIIRRPGAVAALWAVTPSLSALRGALAAAGHGDGLLVATDLTLGAWVPGCAARELAAQLDLPPPRLRQDGNLEPTSFGRSAAVIGHIIDAESRGDETVIAAIDNAALCAGRMARLGMRLLLVMVPCYGEAWDRFDLVFLKMLAQMGQGTFRLLFAAGGEGAAAPAGFDLTVVETGSAGSALTQTPPAAALLPGLLREGEAGAAQGLPLAGGRRLVPPEQRRPPHELPPGFDRELPEAGERAPYYTAYWGALSAGASARLLGLAGRAFAEGGHMLALRLAARAEALATSRQEMIAAHSMAQGIRIANLAYAEAADADLPDDEGMPGPLRGMVRMGRAWGAVMTGRPAIADPLFTEAATLLDGHIGEREALYFRNIHALAKFRLGQTDIALGFEKEIERRLAALAEPDWHLMFINSINQARLYRHMGDIGTARDYYRRAFDTSRGARSESDALYYSHTLAMLERKGGDHLLALRHMVRAVLYWLSARHPEALAKRVTVALLRQAVIPDPAELVEAVSRRLEGDLTALAGAAGYLADPWPEEVPPVFVQADENAPGVATTAMGLTGIGMLMAREPVPPAFDGPAYTRLARCLFTLLTVMMPGLAAAGRTVIIGSHAIREIPWTRADLLDLALWADARSLVFEGQAWELTPAAKTEAAATMMVKLHPLVSGTGPQGQGIAVRFKRLARPQLLSPLAGPLIEGLRAPVRVADLAARLPQFGTPDALLTVLRGLEQGRIAQLFLPSGNDVGEEMTLQKVI